MSLAGWAGIEAVAGGQQAALYRRKDDLGGHRLQFRWLPSRLIPHCHRPRAELQPAHELQVDMLR
jgi:hypothetical protein